MNLIFNKMPLHRYSAGGDLDKGSKIDLLNGDCLDLLPAIPDKSVDIVLTDPPYLYLAAKWEVPFDEDAVFAHFMRIVKDDGFICFFGRGVSFYRWNMILSNLGAKFLEEIVWGKNMNSSLVHPLCRVHELCNVYTPKNGKIRRSRINPADNENVDYEGLAGHIKRISASLDNHQKLKKMKDFLTTGNFDYDVNRKLGKEMTVEGAKKKMSDDIMSLRVITDGMLEKSIITCRPPHFDTLHETQKPVKLLERIMLICKDFNEGVVLDAFMGSGSTGVACLNQGRQFVGIEKDENYYNVSKNRIKEELNKGDTLF
jgi:site-specific DNA-methyltransferase (adenine-specific)